MLHGRFSGAWFYRLDASLSTSCIKPSLRLWKLDLVQFDVCRLGLHVVETTSLLILLCFFAMYRLMADRGNQSESYAMEISVCEIYNNDVRDLLSDKSTRVSTIKSRLPGLQVGECLAFLGNVYVVSSIKSLW